MHKNYERGLYEGEEYQYWHKVNALKEKLAFLERTPEAVIDRAARTLLNLYDSWEWATKEKRRMLVRTMVQEVGCDVGTKRIVWVKVKPDHEILFRLMDRLDPAAERRCWIREQGKEGNIQDRRDWNQNFPAGVSQRLDNCRRVRAMKEYHLKSKIAQLELSDLGRSSLAP